MDIWEQEALGTSKIDVHGKKMQIIKIHATQTCVVISGTIHLHAAMLAASIGLRKKKTPAVQPPLTTHTHTQENSWLGHPCIGVSYFSKSLFLFPQAIVFG
jgi:hypothetical protein